MKKTFLYFLRFCFLHVFPIKLTNKIYVPLFHKLKFILNTNLKITIISGIKLKITPSDWVQYCLFIRNFYEEKETKFVQRFLKNGDVFVDIGTNIGYYSLLASQKVGNNGRVYSFEPVKKTFNRLVENVKLNKAQNIVVNKVALGKVNSEITINVGNEQNWGMSSITIHSHLSGITEKVNCIRLDDYVIDNNILKIDLIKIDIEGSEFFALQGMEIIINRFKPVILVELLNENLLKTGASVQTVFEWFEKRNYQPYIIDGEDSTLIPINVAMDSELMVFKSN